MYDMRVNCPSAGTKETTLSAAKRESRTEGWKEYSSMRCELLSDRDTSGMPLSREFTSTVPWMAELSTRPSLSSVASMDSITSR